MRQGLCFLVLMISIWASSVLGASEVVTLQGGEAKKIYNSLDVTEVKLGNRIKAKTVAGLRCRKSHQVSNAPTARTLDFKCTISRDMDQNELEQVYNALQIEEKITVRVGASTLVKSIGRLKLTRIKKVTRGFPSTYSLEI